MPQVVRPAYDETLELFRCVEGRQAGTTDFIEALTAEACSGAHPPGVECVALPADRREGPHIERALARLTANWRHLDSAGPPAELTGGEQQLARSDQRLANGDRQPVGEDEEMTARDPQPAGGDEEMTARDPQPVGGDQQTTAGHDDLAAVRTLAFLETAPASIDPDQAIRRLLLLQDDLERRLGQLLARIGETGAWKRMRFAGLGHYAEERLGMARTSARERAAVARALRRLSTVRAAYESGRIGMRAALCVARLLRDRPAGDDTQRAWVARAERATLKRLEDEARALRRAQAVDPLGQHAERMISSTAGDSAPAAAATRQPRAERMVSIPRRPLTDAEWHASLHREVGIARQRVWRFGMLAVAAAGCGGVRQVPLTLHLPADVAEGFLGAVEAARRRPWHAEPIPRPSSLAARRFQTNGQTVPAWVGVLALLEDFVATWDVRHGARSREEAIYARDGWRCLAPGCTSRRNLEAHHVVYRSRGGADDGCNRVALCRFHHQQGEHGELANVRGVAPLGLSWSLGRRGRGGRFRNEIGSDATS